MATQYKVLDNNNVEYITDNLEDFCNEYNLSYSSMVRVANGHAKSHKGYWIYHVDPALYENAKQNRKNLKMETKRREKDDETILYNTETKEIVTVTNLTGFCKDYELNKGAISMVMKGIRHSHKGWTVLKEEE